MGDLLTGRAYRKGSETPRPRNVGREHSLSATKSKTNV